MVINMYLLNGKIKIVMATNFSKRLLGFMGKKKRIEEGICFPRCNSIHTFFMKQNIDVIMTDKKQKILYLYPNLKKNKIIFPKKEVYYTYELPLTSIDSLQVGNTITLTKE